VQLNRTVCCSSEARAYAAAGSRVNSKYVPSLAALSGGQPKVHGESAKLSGDEEGTFCC